MKPVRLTRQLTLEARQRTPDGAGGFRESWQALGALWASLEPRRGALGDGDLVVSQVKTDVIVRGSPVGSASRPEPRQRFRMGARVWRILSVAENDPQGRYLRCATVEETVP